MTAFDCGQAHCNPCPVHEAALDAARADLAAARDLQAYERESARAELVTDREMLDMLVHCEALRVNPDALARELYREDVPTLIAEIRRLRTELHAWSTLGNPRLHGMDHDTWLDEVRSRVNPQLRPVRDDHYNYGGDL